MVGGGAYIAELIRILFEFTCFLKLQKYRRYKLQGCLYLQALITRCIFFCLQVEGLINEGELYKP